MWAALFAAAAGLGILGYLAIERQPPDDDPWQLLATALGPDRPFEPLVSGLSHLPFRPTRSRALTRAPSPDLQLAAARLEKNVDRSPVASRRAAIARLLFGNPDGAVSLLERAVAAAPSDVPLRADLAGAYLIRADASGGDEDLARALDAGEHAVAADPSVPEAWFNLALARERLHLVRDAARAWRSAAVSSGPWAAEARSHAEAMSESTRELQLDRLEPRIGTGGTAGDGVDLVDDADLFGELLERRVLDDWAAAVDAGDAGQALLLAARARAMGIALHRATGDRFHASLVADLVDAPPARIRAYANGWRRHVTAMRARDENRLPLARAAHADAEAVFGPAPSAINAARVALATGLDRLAGRRDAAIRRLRTFQRYCHDNGFVGVCGRVHWQLGLFAGEAGDVGESLSEYATALDLVTRARDRESAAVVNALVAAEYLELDDFDRAWQHEARALAALHVTRRSRRDPILTTASMLATSAGFHAGALSFRRPLIEDMKRAGADVSLAFLLTDDALNLHGLGRTQDALGRIAEAREAAARVDDEGTALLAQALQNSTEAAILGADRPDRAAELLGEAIGIHRRRGNDFAVPPLELERGRAFVAAGRFDRAVDAFTRGVNAVDRVRPGLAGDAERAALMSARWDLYAALADLRIRQRDERSAAVLLDRARAGEAADHVEATSAAAAALAPGDAAVEFAILPSGVHGWLTAGAGRRHFVLAQSAKALSDSIAGYRALVLTRAPDQELRKRSIGLFTAILGPVAREIAGARRLILVLDGPLHDLPFSSLVDPVSGRYLIERSAILVTPALLTFGRRSHRPAGPASRALVVGGPDRSTATSDRLPDLAGSRNEARSVAALYPGAALAVGPDATREYFVARARGASFIHFAGHAVVNERRPELSRLLFAPSARNPAGALFANEIGQMDLSGVRLVVLSACDTARGRIARGVGIVGLARSFLAGSVPSVVATLWPVDDRSASDLFASFHRSWARGLDSAEALREAQVASLRSGLGVADWAGPIVVGRAVTR